MAGKRAVQSVNKRSSYELFSDALLVNIIDVYIVIYGHIRGHIRTYTVIYVVIYMYPQTFSFVVSDSI